MKFTLKNLRRKERSFDSASSVPSSPKEKKTDLTSVKAQSSHNGQARRLILVPFPPSPMTFIDVDPYEHGRNSRPSAFRQRSKSTGNLNPGKNNSPAETPPKIPSSPACGDAHETAPHPSGFEKTPRRPPRPPQHLLPCITTGELRSTVYPDPTDPVVEPDSPTLPSPISPLRARSTWGVAPHRRSRRPAPELEGVWRDFLQNAGEEMDPLDLRLSESPESEIIQSYFFTAPPPAIPSKDVRKLSRPSTAHASASDPCLRQNFSGSKPGSLADMFPVPPSLSARKRLAPAPLQLHRHTSTEPQGPVPVLSPVYGCSSPELTPVATPNTPRFAQQQRRHAGRHPPSPGPLTPSFEFTPPPSPSLHTPLNQSSEDLPRHQLRNAHSSSQLRYSAKAGKKTKYHRPSSSESSSDRSNMQPENETHSPPYGELNYLQSCGRRPNKCAIRQVPIPIEQGLAL